MTSNTNCRFYGSMIGCKKGVECRFSHSNPESVPLCKNYAKCQYEKKCKFRHDKYPSSTDRNKRVRRVCLLDHTPDAIVQLIYDLKLEMECCELSQVLNKSFQEQLECLILKSELAFSSMLTNGGSNLKQVINKKIKTKRVRIRNMLSKDYAFSLIKEYIFVSKSEMPTLFHVEHKFTLKLNEFDNFASEFEDCTCLDRKMMKKMRLEIEKMPYEYVGRRMKIDRKGKLILAVKFGENALLLRNGIVTMDLNGAIEANNIELSNSQIV